MNDWRRSLVLWGVFVLLAIFLGFAAAQRSSAQQPAATEQDLPNFHVMNSQVGTCGQPTEEGFKEIARKGYKSVLNLRTPAEGSESERAVVEKLGMRYINIPVSPDSINEQAADRFRQVMRDKSNEPVFVHCRSANRVGGMMILYLVLDKKESLDDAVKQAHQIGFSDMPWLKDFVLDYIKRHQSQ